MCTELSDLELHFYSRHILLEQWDIEAQERLKSSHVLIVGAGGIGCSSAEILARAGVGKITIIDFDHIDVSNLQRQTAFTIFDLDQTKVQVLVDYLRKVNPYIKIKALNMQLDNDNIQKLATNYDLVLDGCDNFATRDLMNRFCLQHHIPLLSASAIAYEGQLLFVKGQPCYQCLFADAAQDDQRRCATSGVLTTTPILMATLQAHHALLYLGLQQAPLLNKLLLWNGLTMQQRIVNIQADPDCQCAKTAK